MSEFERELNIITAALMELGHKIHQFIESGIDKGICRLEQEGVINGSRCFFDIVAGDLPAACNGSHLIEQSEGISHCSVRLRSDKAERFVFDGNVLFVCDITEPAYDLVA